MLLSIHELRNENREIIFEKKEVAEETLYNELKGKKEKLIQQIKTEKVIDPKCQKEADEAIENIKKLRCGHGEVGRIFYYYESLKGMYFYIHKIIKSDSSCVDTIRFYCTTPSEAMYSECKMSDPLIAK